MKQYKLSSTMRAAIAHNGDGSATTNSAARHGPPSQHHHRLPPAPRRPGDGRQGMIVNSKESRS